MIVQGAGRKGRGCRDGRDWTGFFWDGRAVIIREQALHPIQDPVEMNESLDNVVSKLSEMKVYRDQFIRAFGSPDITPERIGLAIEQFELTIISVDSKYDRFDKGTATLTEAEERGRQIFFANSDLANGKKGGECVHCHGGPNLANDFFVNNGLDSEADFQTWEDLKLPIWRVTGQFLKFLHFGILH